jgi:hypothetical protein
LSSLAVLGGFVSGCAPDSEGLSRLSRLGGSGLGDGLRELTAGDLAAVVEALLNRVDKHLPDLEAVAHAAAFGRSLR